MCWRLLHVADFVYVFVFWLRTQRSAVASRRATTLATHSVADPGCLSRIPDPTFFHPGSRIPDPNCLHPGSRILIKIPTLATHLPNILHFCVTTFRKLSDVNKKRHRILMPIRISTFHFDANPNLDPDPDPTLCLIPVGRFFYFHSQQSTVSSLHGLFFLISVTGVKIVIFRIILYRYWYGILKFSRKK